MARWRQPLTGATAVGDQTTYWSKYIALAGRHICSEGVLIIVDTFIEDTRPGQLTQVQVEQPGQGQNLFNVNARGFLEVKGEGAHSVWWACPRVSASGSETTDVYELW